MRTVEKAKVRYLDRHHFLEDGEARGESGDAL